MKTNFASVMALFALAGLASCGGSPYVAELPEPEMAPVAAATPVSDSIDRSKPPELAPPPSLDLPPVIQRKLPNGLTVLIVEHHELPLLDAMLLVGSGGERDPENKDGLVTLVSGMLLEGTTSRTGLQIAAQEATLGASVGAGSGWETSRITLHTPTAQLDSALALFADVALHPSFPAEELERLRKERLTSLLQLRDRGPAIADRAFASIVYGPDHPYGHPPGGTESGTEAITRADLTNFYSTFFRPNNATLLIVGDVNPDDIMARVQRLFGAWAGGPIPPADYGTTPSSHATTIYLIDKPGAPQSSVRIGTVGVPRSTDDYFALLVMNTVLGGSFTSRLNQNLRETKGYTYGARSSFDMRKAAGPFIASAEVTGSKTDSSVLEFMKELRGILDTVPSSELEKTKKYLQLRLPSRFETTRDIAFQLAPIVTYDLPLDYYNSYVERIGEVTQADVQRVAREYITPSRLAVVIVGDRASIEAGLRALNIGPVEIRDITGAKVTP